MKLQPLRKLTLKSIAVSMAVMVAATTMTAPAHAGLKEAMNQMFVSASTDAQVINTQRLKGMYGGSMTLRPMSAGISVVQFAPPRIDAGCGGIDIFFGSFSFINGAQFEQLIRSIAANAVGFAIKAAIDRMCEPCGKLIAELDDAMRKLNAMTKNTCAIANQLSTQEGRQKLMESASAIGGHLSRAAGHAADSMKAENWKLFSSPNETASGKSPGTGASAAAAVAESNPFDGNVVYIAAKKSMANGTNSLRAFLSEQDAISLVMGLYGVAVFNPDPKGESCPAGTPPERCVKLVEKKEPTITTWDNLMYPRKHHENGVPAWTCGGSECRDLTGTFIPLSTWGGVEDAVNVALFGSPLMPLSPQMTTPDSLVGSFVHKSTSATLSPSAMRIAKIIPMPVLSMLTEVQHIEGAAMTLGMHLSDALPRYFAYQMALEMQGIGANVFSGQTAKDMPTEFRTNLMQKAQNLIAIKPPEGELVKIFNETTQAIINMNKLTGSKLKTGGK